MAQFPLLLAKRPSNLARPEPEETLLGHSQAVQKMADLVLDILAPHFKDVFIADYSELEQWKLSVRLSAWMHDWGKANDHFQTMIRNTAFRQGVRHEALSLVICAELWDWLSPAFQDSPQWASSAVLFAVAGHHLKFPDPLEDTRAGTKVTLLIGSADFNWLLRNGTEIFDLGEPPRLKDETLSLLGRGPVNTTLRRLQRELDNDFNERERVLIAATKVTLMAADLAGSALPLKISDPAAWIRDRLQRSLTTEQLEQVVHTKLKGKKPRDFQIRVSQTSRRTALVEAGCGSGKTAAAYLWAAAHARDKRLFFCYPTTGTASEGFAGYLNDPDFDAILLHSRAEVDYRLLENMPQKGHEENDLRQARLEALETWPVPAVVCTAHTVLGIMENVRRGIYAWPSMAQAVFVFDEVHAFSDRLFSYLLRFLRAFPGAHVLLMTATLPVIRRRALEECCNSRGGLAFIAGPRSREDAKRYQLHRADPDDAWSELHHYLDRGGKILWVCNTVRRAMETLDKCLEKDLPAQPYHSRYRYRDRLIRHRTVIDGFSPGQPPMVAITTQVAEMSLDLSADLLISDYAPVPSMIQRLGRLNRFEEVPASLGIALFLETESTLPYDAEAIAGVPEWLQVVADGEPRSQADLAAAFVDVVKASEKVVEPVVRCEWLDGLWFSLKDKRAIEEAGYTVEVILERDMGRGPPVELAIPMPTPRHLDFRGWARTGRYVVAPEGTIIYDEFRGAEWTHDHQ